MNEINSNILNKNKKDYLIKKIETIKIKTLFGELNKLSLIFNILSIKILLVSVSSKNEKKSGIDAILKNSSIIAKDENNRIN